MNSKFLTFTIVGRPNVGKSTLFNRLSGKKIALTGDYPGITRDRRIGYGKIGDMTFRIIDTAGYENLSSNSLQKKMFEKTKNIFKETNIFFMLINAKEGLLNEDIILSQIIKRIGLPIILLCNKYDGKTNSFIISDAWSLGLGEPILISAEHGNGFIEVFNRILEIAKNLKKEQLLFNHNLKKNLEYIFPQDITYDDKNNISKENYLLNISVVGRPNMGKSTLVNSLLRKEIVLTGPESGITRDAVSITFCWKDLKINLIDTAGIRRKSKINEDLENLTIKNAMRAIQFSNLCILTVDASQNLSKQDLNLARLISNEGRALIIAANMWDKVIEKEKTKEFLNYKVSKSLSQLDGIPIVPISGLKKTGLDSLMQKVNEILKLWNKRISTNKLNDWLLPVLEKHPPPVSNGRRIKIRYITQIKSRPPTFVLFCNLPSKLPRDYFRYLQKQIRVKFNFIGVPIRFLLKKGENPYIKN